VARLKGLRYTRLYTDSERVISAGTLARLTLLKYTLQNYTLKKEKQFRITGPIDVFFSEKLMRNK